MPNKIKIAMNMAGKTVSDLAKATRIPSERLMGLLDGYGVSLGDAVRVAKAVGVSEGDIFVFQGDTAYMREKGGDLRIIGNKLLNAMANADMTIDELSDASGVRANRIKEFLSFDLAARPTEAEVIGDALSVDYNDVFVHQPPNGFFVREKGGRL